MTKVLHIATMDYGGAGIAARRIHESLLKQGVDSHLLVCFKQSDDDTITVAKPNMGLYIPPTNPLKRKIEQVLRRRGKCLTEAERCKRQIELLDRHYGAAFTMPISNYDLTQHPLVQQADIIHLHWVENFIDYPTFFSRIDKPIIWTFHDENIAYGGFHYSDEASRLQEPFSALEQYFVETKQRALATTGLKIQMVALSRMMEQFYHEKAINNTFPVEIIHNGFVPEDFPMLDRDFCRKTLGLSLDEKVLCFCASDINDNHKGLKTLVNTMEHMQSHDITLLCVGKGRLPKCSFNIVGTNTIANPRLLALAYSASDLFVMPSYQEAFAQAPLEAMACGCPVVASPCSGTEELINDANGIRCQEFTEEALSDSILAALATKYDRHAIREDAVERFNIEKKAKQYIDLYNRCR